MSREIVATVDPFETRVAVVEDGILVNLFVERGEPLAGNIYKARVANVLRGMDAAFLDIRLARNAFLHVADVRSQRVGGEELEDIIGEGAITQRLRPGQEILVQVTKEPMGTKGPRVTSYIAIPAYYAVLMPTVNYVGVSRRIENDAERKRLREIADRVRPKGMGLIVRTAAAGIDEKQLSDDVRYLQTIWDRVLDRAKTIRAPALIYQDLKLIQRTVRDLLTEDVTRFVTDSSKDHERVLDLVGTYAPALRGRVELYRGAEPLFEHFGVERELQNVLRRKVWMKSGGYLVIDRTEALTVIDVNTGKFVGKHDLATTILHLNLEAVAEVARQIRLRDLGGIILVDFIDMDNDTHRQRVFKALQEAMKKDRSGTHLLGFTQLGLVEITRKRVYQDLEEIMRTPCPYCEGRGRVLSAETTANKVRRELRKLSRTSKARALQVHLHPLVFAELEKKGNGWLRHLEESTGKLVRLTARDGMHVEQMDVIPANSGAELEAVAASRGVAEVHWLDVDESTVDVAEDEELAQARAMAAAPAERPGLWGRVSSILRRGRTS